MISCTYYWLIGDTLRILCTHQVNLILVQRSDLYIHVHMCLNMLVRVAQTKV